MYNENAINSYNELMDAVTKATSGDVKFLAEEKGTLTMRLSRGFKVVVYEDNHTVNLEFKYGNIIKRFYCPSYEDALETILNAENGNVDFQKYISKNSFARVFIRAVGISIFLLGVALFIVGTFGQVVTIYGAISDSFRPVYVYLSLVLSFMVALFGASALMYLGRKLIKRKICDKTDEFDNR